MSRIPIAIKDKLSWQNPVIDIVNWQGDTDDDVGNRYIISSSPSSQFSGYEHHIVYYDQDLNFVFIQPEQFWRVHVLQDNEDYYYYNGAWIRQYRVDQHQANYDHDDFMSRSGDTASGNYFIDGRFIVSPQLILGEVNQVGSNSQNSGIFGIRNIIGDSCQRSFIFGHFGGVYNKGQYVHSSGDIQSQQFGQSVQTPDLEDFPRHQYSRYILRGYQAYHKDQLYYQDVYKLKMLPDKLLSIKLMCAIQDIYDNNNFSRIDYVGYINQHATIKSQLDASFNMGTLKDDIIILQYDEQQNQFWFQINEPVLGHGFNVTAKLEIVEVIIPQQ